MSMFGFRNKLKSAVKNVFGVEEAQKNVDWSPPKSPPAEEPVMKEELSLPEEVIEEEMEEKEEPSTGGENIPMEEGLPLTVENMEEILDDFVRPGLQADGGDITLVKIDGNDVYVQLQGACQTCSSAVMTMKMGVEALLREEFPQMRELIDVTHA